MATPLWMYHLYYHVEPFRSIRWAWYLYVLLPHWSKRMEQAKARGYPSAEWTPGEEMVGNDLLGCQAMGNLAWVLDEIACMEGRKPEML
jgi:hypothetical protein